MTCECDCGACDSLDSEEGRRLWHEIAHVHNDLAAMREGAFSADIRLARLEAAVKQLAGGLASLRLSRSRRSRKETRK